MYPQECTTPEDKLSWVLSAKEDLKTLRNIFAKWFREGLTQAEYDKLPPKFKNKYPYKEKLSDDEFRSFVLNDYDTRKEKIVKQWLIQRDICEKATRWTVDLFDI